MQPIRHFVFLFSSVLAFPQFSDKPNLTVSDPSVYLDQSGPWVKYQDVETLEHGKLFHDLAMVSQPETGGNIDEFVLDNAEDEDIAVYVVEESFTRAAVPWDATELYTKKTEFLETNGTTQRSNRTTHDTCLISKVGIPFGFAKNPRIISVRFSGSVEGDAVNAWRRIFDDLTQPDQHPERVGKSILVMSKTFNRREHFGTDEAWHKFQADMKTEGEKLTNLGVIIILSTANEGKETKSAPAVLQKDYSTSFVAMVIGELTSEGDILLGTNSDELVSFFAPGFGACSEGGKIIRPRDGKLNF